MPTNCVLNIVSKSVFTVMATMRIFDAICDKFSVKKINILFKVTGVLNI
jgi:hypothetical protein